MFLCNLNITEIQSVSFLPTILAHTLFFNQLFSNISLAYFLPTYLTTVNLHSTNKSAYNLSILNHPFFQVLKNSFNLPIPK